MSTPIEITGRIWIAYDLGREERLNNPYDWDFSPILHRMEVAFVDPVPNPSFNSFIKFNNGYPTSYDELRASYVIQNAEATMGKYASLSMTEEQRDNVFSLSSILDENPEYRVITGEDYDNNGNMVPVWGNIQTRGHIAARFHPPIEDGFHYIVDRFLKQDIPVANALYTVIRQGRKVNDLAVKGLKMVARQMNGLAGTPGREPVSAPQAADKIWEYAIEMECAENDCWGDLDYFEDVVKVIDQAYLNMQQQEAEGIAEGKMVEIDWQTALQEAQKSTGILHPPIHHLHTLSDNAGLDSYSLRWTTPIPGSHNLDTTIKHVRVVMGDTDHEADIPSNVTTVTLNARPKDVDGTIYVNGLLKRKNESVDIEVPSDVYETVVEVTVVAQNQVAKENHTITMVRENLAPPQEPAPKP